MDDPSHFCATNLLHTQEKMRRYAPGGFHPVRLGDKFKDGRYTVYHKLGWGGFSTVWLVGDAELNVWVALKITTASSPKPSKELEVFQYLRQKGAAHHLALLLDSFIHKGPNGSHQCLVFELLGPSVDTVVADYSTSGDRLAASTILRIARQLLQALASMHAEGYAHGDISGSNVVFTAHKLAQSSLESIFDVIGAPKPEDLIRCDGEQLSPGLPEQLVEKAGWDDWIDEDDEDIRVIDLGEAFAQGAEPVHLSEPGGLQVPEGIFTGRFDYRLDLWRAGCTIYTTVMGSRPFQFLSEIDVLVAQMIHFVEELPPEWKPKWEQLKEKAGRKWDQIPDSMPPRSKLEDRFERKAREACLKPLLPIMQGLLRFRPSDRISAAAALRLL
ncbi:kinase-like protein, partial [Coniochaeta ligniaria NRRL 30616]